MNRQHSLGSAHSSAKNGHSRNEYKAPGTGQTHVTVATNSNHASFYNGEGGERVRVALRIRPLSTQEQQRNDEKIIACPDEQHVHLNIKGPTKGYRFNAALDEHCKQHDVFQLCGVSELIDSALQGYSATIFAYGQTGSGKTYTMAGIEDKIGKEGWVSDDNDGLIPRSVRYMWQQMTLRPEKFYVKASFLEIYNEQL